MVCAAAMVAACGAAGSTGPAATGSLSVAVTAAAGVRGAITVAGPQGYTTTLGASRLFAQLPTGTYTLSADSVVTLDTIVGSRTDVPNRSAVEATVVRDDTADVAITYTLRGRRGAMWVANSADTAVFELAPDSLRVSGAPTPESWVGGLQNPTGMVLDRTGNLWIVSDASDTIVMLTPEQRAAGAHPGGALTLSDTGIHNAVSAAMAPDGTLWVSSQATLRGYSPAQLAAGGVQAAARVIAVAGPVDAQLVGVAFDSAGDAWVADCETSSLLHFTAAQLAASGSPAPVDTIGADSASASLVCPSDIAYDARGNLWVLNFYGASIVSFSPNELAASGHPVPQVKLTLAPQALPWGMAFDQHGALWVGDYWHDLLDVFSPAQLRSGGAIAPADTVVGPGGTTHGASFIVFDPDAPDVTETGPSARIRSHTPVARRAVAELPGQGIRGTRW